MRFALGLLILATPIVASWALLILVVDGLLNIASLIAG